MDTKFSVAVHTLILISEAPKPFNSTQIAESVGTNPSYIRKILSLLKKSKMIESHRGVSGYVLTTSPAQITMLNIYQAVMDAPKIHLLDIHQNPNDQCIVGRHIKPMLTKMFDEIEQTFARELLQKTLADCITAMKESINQTEKSKYNK